MRVRGRLVGKVAVVTGAASGIGAAIARRFSQEGATLILGDLNVALGEAVARDLPHASFLRADVTVERDVERLCLAAQERHGRLDCMINNAGLVGSVGSIRDIPGQGLRDELAVLLESVFYGMKHAARIMVPQREGAILSTSSVAGIAALGPHAYTAAKHAVVGLTKSVAAELAPSGIRVNAVGPGTVPTGLTAGVYGAEEAAREASAARSPLGRAIEPDDIAATFVHLASDDARNVTGQLLIVDGGLTACPVVPVFHKTKAGFVGPSGS